MNKTIKNGVCLTEDYMKWRYINKPNNNYKILSYIEDDVVKGYLLPKTVSSKSLIVVTSVSGNTEETLNVLSSAYEMKCKLIAFSDGGKIQ